MKGDYRPDIDGLRAVAIVPVVLFHAGLELFSGGFVGVDIFFVISGYLITAHIRAEISQERFSIVSFYERRIRRIFPALFVMLFVCCVGAYLLLFPIDMVAFGESMLAAALSVSNIYFWQALGDYFAVQADLQPLLHTWSLGVEEQFYVFLPLIIVLASRYLDRNLVFLLLAALAAGSFALGLAGMHYAPVATFYLLPTRAWELLAGSLTSFFVTTSLDHKWRSTIGAIGLALIGVTMFGYTNATPFPGAAALLPVAGSVMVILAGFGSSTISTKILSLKPLRFIGWVSYSWYLWHWPILVFSRHFKAAELSSFDRVMLVCISFLVAVASWLMIERPFRVRAVAASSKYMFLTGGAAVVMSVAIAMPILTYSGLPRRFPGLEQTRIEREDFRPDVCFFRSYNGIDGWDPEKCKLASSEDGSRAILWGSSYAMHYAPGIQALGRELNANVYLFAHAGCEPIFSFQPASRPTCKMFNASIDEAVKKAAADTVIISGIWRRQEIQLQDIEETIKYLIDRGIKVVLLGQSPQFGYTSAQAIFYQYEKRRSHNGPAELRVPPVVDIHFNDQFNTMSKSASIIDPLKALCTDAGCLFAKDGSPLYSDSGHLTSYGSKFSLSLMLNPLKSSLEKKAPIKNKS